MCEYKIKSGSDGKLMPIKISKVLFHDTNSADLNKSIDEKVVLHTYNNSCIPQMDVWKVTIIKNGIKFICNFFIVP